MYNIGRYIGARISKKIEGIAIRILQVFALNVAFEKNVKTCKMKCLWYLKMVICMRSAHYGC